VPIQLELSAGFLDWPFPALKYKYICVRKDPQKQLYQTALGNGYGLKLAACRLQISKLIYHVIYYNFRQTFVPYRVGRGSPADQSTGCNCEMLLRAESHHETPWAEARNASDGVAGKMPLSNFIHQRVIEKKNQQKTAYNEHQNTIDMQDYQAVTCV